VAFCCGSDTDVGWAVANRVHTGNDVVQTWITPILFTCHGVVTQWRYWSGRSAPFRAMVLRNVTADWTLFDIIGINDIPAGATEQVVTYQVPDNERIVVQEGDVFGFAWNLPAAKHVVEGNIGDYDVLSLMYVSGAVPDDLKVNDRLDATGTFTNMIRAYSIQAVVAGMLV